MNTDEKIMALSWKEPFATLMLHGKIETRTWNTNYRGLVLICASQTPYAEKVVRAICGDRLVNSIKELFERLNICLHHGQAIAVGRLVDSRPMTLEDEDKCFVQYRPAWKDTKKSKDGSLRYVTKRLYCHVYEDVRKIKPFPWKGCQGWKKVDQQTIDQIVFE